MNWSILNIVVDSVKYCALLYDKDAEIFKEDGERINRICKLANFFATMLSLYIVHLLLI